MSDDTPQLRVETPDIPGGQEAAALIIRLLRQDEEIDPHQITFDDVFFSVLNAFIEQARESGFADEQNPFLQMDGEIRKFIEHLAAERLQDVPEEFREDMQRFQHLTQEAVHDAGLLVPAVKILEDLIPRIDPAAHTKFWGNLHNDLGSTYVELPVANREKAISKAIAAFEVALEARPVTEYPYDHAAALHNLGSAYLNSPLGDRDETLRKALTCFEGVARFVKQDELPADYGVLQFNLGTALNLLHDGDIDGQQRRAAAAFDASESVFGRDYPSGWAIVQVRRAQGHHYGPRPDLKAAIACYKAAREVYTLDENKWEAIAATVQQALAELQHQPNTVGRSKAHSLLSPLDDALAGPRPSQQHATLMMSFGPPYNGQARLPRVAALKASLETAAGPFLLAEARLQLVCFDPANAQKHLQAALSAVALR